MNIEHKLEPIEHWIVDGKAYRMATEADLGRTVLVADLEIAKRRSPPDIEKTLAGIRYGKYRYEAGGTVWLCAYVQDDSLLTPQRTPVPALGEGWYLLRDDEVLQKGDRISGSGIDAHGVTWLETGCVGMNVGMWRGGIEAHCCARYFGPTEDAEIEPGPTEEPPPKTIDWTKPVRTKDGRAVRVLCTDGPGDYPVVGLTEGDITPDTWTINGRFRLDSDSTRDLENAPQRIQREYWVNVYPEDVIAYSTKLRADETRATSCLACVKITIDCEEGEGL